MAPSPSFSRWHSDKAGGAEAAKRMTPAHLGSNVFRGGAKPVMRVVMTSPSVAPVAPATPVSHAANGSAGQPISRSLFVLSVFYGGMVCIAGVLGNKQVALGPLAVEAGIFAFLLLVVVSSAVAELHGRAVANRLVRYGFIPLIASILLALLVLFLPASPGMEPERLGAFDLMMRATPRIWVAGIIAYGVSQTLNVSIFSALRRPGGSYLWLRGAVAGVLSQIVDTLLFITVAFYGIFPITELLAGQLLAKVALSIVLVPVLIQACVALGRRLDRPAAD